MTFENSGVFNIEGAIRGMRNPLNSHGKSDSATGADGRFVIGKADADLAGRLIAAGEPHRKFLRQIFTSVDILKMPMYLMIEFQTYKLGTTLDSSSTMHKITSRELTADDFEAPETDLERIKLGDDIVALNQTRELYLEHVAAKERDDAERCFRAMKRMLPSAYLYERMTWTANYEVLRNIYKWRRSHRLPKWREFCEGYIEKLPYSEFITGYGS